MVRLCTLLLVAAACGDVDPPPLDAGSADADMGAMPILHVLEVRSETSVPLMPGETADIEVRLHDQEGRSVTNTRLEFALVGTANDSSLNRIEGLTDGGGRANANIVAGMVPGMFRVRISADAAAAVYVEVSVSDRGFGDVEVEPIYVGERSGVFTVAVIASAQCSDDDLLNDRSRYRNLADARTIRFEGLPVGVPIAVVGRLDSSDGVDDGPLARGCVDGTMVVDGETSNVELPIEDVPLVTSGAYETLLQIETAAFAMQAGVAFESVILAPAEDGSAVLDVLEAYLAREGALDALQAVQRARAERDLDARYNTELTTWPAPARLTAEFARVTSELESITVSAELRIGETTMMATDGLESGGLPLSRDRVGAAIELRAELSDTGDTLEVGLLAAHVAGGDLVTAVLLRAAETAEFVTVREWIASLVDCASMPSPMEASCDAACALAVCHEHIAGLADRFVSATAELNMTWPRLEFSGSMLFSDDDGDRFSDQVHAEFSGHWGETDIVSVLTGRRIVVGM